MSKKPVLVISGGSSGIGQATALYFAQRGYSVYELHSFAALALM